VDDNSRLIIVTTHNESAGIRVDEVSGVNTLPKSVIEPATSFITATESNLLASIARTDRHLILILDITAIFNIAEKATKHSF
jgi:purine-binding chemotaxis protein CheW